MMREIIWAPWRSGFIKGKPEPGCVFCRLQRETDKRKILVIETGKHNFIVMNKFPYTSGHLLVIPKRHLGTLEKLTTPEANEHFKLVRLAASALKRALKTDGINTGMNLGRTAGAGVLHHIHTHLVPRWQGDSNFMPVIGETRMMSLDLEPMYDALCAEFLRLKKKK